MIKTILFDFDGTIADTLPTIVTILRSLSTKYGYKNLTDGESNHMRDYTIKEIFQKMHVPIYKLPLMTYDVKKELNKHIAELKPIKGMKSVLTHLKGQYRLVIITSNNKDNVKAFLKHNDLDFFDYIHTGKTIFGKARVIQGFLKNQAINQKETVYIGDEVRDIEAAKKVGIPIIAVSWGFNSRNGLEKFSPEYIIDKPKELPSLVNKVIYGN